MKTIEINGTLRENTGSKNAKIGKREGQIPCVIYGGEKNAHFTVYYSSYLKLYVLERQNMSVYLKMY